MSKSLILMQISNVILENSSLINAVLLAVQIDPAEETLRLLTNQEEQWE